VVRDSRPPGLNNRIPQGGGWGGRIRTFNLLIQSQLRYRCATPQVPPFGPGDPF
jgi:hypothetical protein